MELLPGSDSAQMRPPWRSTIFLLTVFSCLIALCAYGAALEGYLFKPASLFERICLLAAALGLLHEGIITDLIGAALFALVIVLQRIALAREKRPYLV